MIYPSEFRFKPEKINSNQFTLSVSNGFTVTDTNNISSLKRAALQGDGIWMRYCNNSTLHGFRYLTEENVKTNERCVW